MYSHVEARLENALQSRHGLSLREYCLLDALSRNHGGMNHLRMAEASKATMLSQSGTTRLIARMEDRALLTRNLCETDRRGIYADATTAGLELCAEARLTHDATLRVALAEAAQQPELGSLVKVIATAAEAA